MSVSRWYGGGKGRRVRGRGDNVHELKSDIGQIERLVGVGEVEGSVHGG